MQCKTLWVNVVKCYHSKVILNHIDMLKSLPYLTVLFLFQVGYWNEDEKFVSTAAYISGSNDTYGFQNRSYIVTTILVRSQYISPALAFYFYLCKKK